MFSRLKEQFNDAVSKAGKKISEKEITKKDLDKVLEDLKISLIQSDVALETAEEICNTIGKEMEGKSVKRTEVEETIKKGFEEAVHGILSQEDLDLVERIKNSEKPVLVLFLGFNGSGKCVSGDTSIYTSVGSIKAEDLYEKFQNHKKHSVSDGEFLEPDDLKVHAINPETLKAEQRKVSKIWKLNASQILDIKLSTNKYISVTPEHPFFVIKEGKIIKKPAEHLQKDEFVMIPTRLNHSENEVNFLDELNNEYYVKNEAVAKEFEKYISSSGSITEKMSSIAERFDFGKSAPYYWRNSENIPIEVVKYLGFDIPKEARIGSKNSKKLPIPFSPSEDLAEFLGMFVAEGNVDKKSIHIHNENEEFVERVVCLYKEIFDIDPCIMKNGGLYRISTGIKTVINFLDDIFSIRQSKHNVCEKIATWPIKFQAAFLRGLFSGDGHVSKYKREIELVTSSEKTAVAIAMMLLNLGIVTSKNEKIVNEKKYHRIRVNGDKKLKKWREKIGFIVPQKETTLDRQINKNKQFERTELVPKQGGLLKKIRTSSELTQMNMGKKLGVLNTMVHHYENESKIDKEKLLKYAEISSDKTSDFLQKIAKGDIAWAQVKEVRRNETDSYVYDLTVPKFHNFIADGVVVHNTTTLAKFANKIKDDNETVLAAADTYRAASIEQLEEHADNLDLKVIKHDYGADAAAVVYDAVEHARSEDKDVVVADTAGRSHSDANLMDELEKICRVNEPDWKILVIDSLTGNDAVKQAREFEGKVGVDGVILTKMDVNEKGGAALSVANSIDRPIVYIGVGQGYDDLESFDPEDMVERILD